MHLCVVPVRDSIAELNPVIELLRNILPKRRQKGAIESLCFAVGLLVVRRSDLIPSLEYSAKRLEVLGRKLTAIGREKIHRRAVYRYPDVTESLQCVVRGLREKRRGAR